jgi:general transcription factor 3C polypeptide 4
MDSSALHPTSAIIYVEERDAVVVTLLDGSFHTINNISVDPTLDLVLDSDTFSTDQISIQARLIFAITEQNHRKPSSYISHKDANRIYGAISYDDGPTLAWLHESVFSLSPWTPI